MAYARKRSTRRRTAARSAYRTPTRRRAGAVRSRGRATRRVPAARPQTIKLVIEQRDSQPMAQLAQMAVTETQLRKARF